MCQTEVRFRYLEGLLGCEGSGELESDGEGSVQGTVGSWGQ